MRLLPWVSRSDTSRVWRTCRGGWVGGWVGGGDQGGSNALLDVLWMGGWVGWVGTIRRWVGGWVFRSPFPPPRQISQCSKGLPIHPTQRTPTQPTHARLCSTHPPHLRSSTNHAPTVTHPLTQPISSNPPTHLFRLLRHQGRAFHHLFPPLVQPLLGIAPHVALCFSCVCWWGVGWVHD